MNAHGVRPARALRLFLARLSGWPRRLLAGALLLAALAAELADRSHASGPAPPGRSVAVLAATRDLPAGSVLRPADVGTRRLPTAAVPAGALASGTAVAGRLVAGPVRRGETLTDVRLVGPGLAAELAGSGSVAVPVRLADPAIAVLLRQGSRVDILAATSATSATWATSATSATGPGEPDPGPAAGTDPAAGSGPTGAGAGPPSRPEDTPDGGTGTGDEGGTGGQPAAVLASDVTVLAVLPVDTDGVQGPLLVVGATPATARRLASAQARDGTGLAVTLRPP